MGRLLRQSTYRARALRRAATAAERSLWQLLRGRQLGAKFRRQQALGPIIVDFCSIEAALVVEVDGPYHRRASQRQADRSRDALLTAAGWTVLRFSNDEVLNHPDTVLQRIRSALPRPHDHWL